MMKLTKITTLAALCVISQNAYAVFDIQSAIGTKTGTFTPDSPLGNNSSLEGNSMQLSAHFHVLPSSMFTLGIGLGLSTFSSNDLAEVVYTGPNSSEMKSHAYINDISGLSIGPDITFGLSIPATNLMPFLRYNYALNVWKGKVSLDDGASLKYFDATLKGNGSILGLGFAWSPITSLAITGEYQMQIDDLSVPEVKTFDGINLPKTENRFKSSTLLAGAMFNI